MGDQRKVFVKSLKEWASKKGRPFDLSDRCLDRLLKRPCTICNKRDKTRNHRNVAMVKYREGYKDENVFPTCTMCHQIRHGLTPKEMVSLAVHTILNCPLVDEAFTPKMAQKYRTLAGKLAHKYKRLCKRSKGYSNYNTYRASARKRCERLSGARCASSIFTLSRTEFDEIRRRPCFYCGLPNAMGIDRVYPSIGYIPSNSVPTDSICNYSKQAMHPATYLHHLASVVLQAA
ncbi:hypothetical protein GHT06_003817 [Daphnia sinensis]|uniref:Uncharacterized protein n=1 Tax=Daphnia sinensis TaxID=1820382 RepID=A0AAD5PK04_9CRUS|nr:hypothetical protein GHT06_003817 [Daphnia sinensis]